MNFSFYLSSIYLGGLKVIWYDKPNIYPLSRDLNIDNLPNSPTYIKQPNQPVSQLN